MAKYLFIGQYTAEGARGVMKEGGSRRREAAEQVLGSVGGRIESMHWGFGDDDFYIVADVPSAAAAAAATLTVGGSGTVRIRTVVLMTAEELDEATRQSVTFRPAGT
jgi:uncharacterized protein with GYD domain